MLKNTEIMQNPSWFFFFDSPSLLFLQNPSWEQALSISLYHYYQLSLSWTSCDFIFNSPPMLFLLIPSWERASRPCSFLAPLSTTSTQSVTMFSYFFDNNLFVRLFFGEIRNCQHNRSPQPAQSATIFSFFKNNFFFNLKNQVNNAIPPPHTQTHQPAHKVWIFFIISGESSILFLFLKFN